MFHRVVRKVPRTDEGSLNMMMIIYILQIFNKKEKVVNTIWSRYMPYGKQGIKVLIACFHEY